MKPKEVGSVGAIEPNVQGLLVFLLAWLASCVGFFFLAGSLPVRAAPPSVQVGFGPVLVWVNLIVFVALAIMTIWYAMAALRWTSVVIGGGFVFLFAPFIVQDLPQVLKDTQTGLTLLLIGGLLVAILVYVVGYI